ncbi:MAG: tail fiber domain-containing protein [Chitinophagaceae bacterium]|nr:tail fiber domain-containing protein [Chitinophagaceae bacterium]
MKKLCLLAFLISSISSMYSQMVISPIGGNLIGDSSAIVQINSTTQGFLPPRMTTVQQLAIANPATGLIIFNTDSNQVMVFTDSNWISVGNGTVWKTNGTHVYNSNTGNVGIGVSNPMNKLSASDNNTVVKIHKKSSSTGINYLDDSYKPGMEIFVDSNTINNSSIVQTGSALTINNVRGSALQAISKYGISSYAADGAAGIFSNNSSSPVLLTLGGNVGFGITNPFQKLEIDGAFKLGDTSTTALTNNGVIRYNPTEGFQGKHNNDWQSLSSPWVKNNNDIINSNTGNVGIGVSNPMNKLSASDNNTVVKIHKKSSSTGINYIDDSYKPGMEIFVDSNTINNSSIVQTGSALTINNVRGSALQAISKYGISSYAADGAAGIFSNNSSSPVLLTLGGNVGFGIPNPFQKLELNGAIKLADTSTDFSANNGVIRYNPTEGFQGKHNNDWQSLSSPWEKNNNDIINSNTGNVGIGVSNPMNKLSASDNNTVVKIHKKSSSTGINYIDDSYKPGMEIFVDSNTINNSSIVQTGSALTINNVRGSALHANSKYGISSYAADGAAGIFSNNSSSPVLLTLGGNVGFGITNPFQKLEIDGAIKLGDTSTTGLTNNGVIRYNPTEGFQGKHNNVWKNLLGDDKFGKSANHVYVLNDTTGTFSVGSTTTLPTTKMTVLGTTSDPIPLYLSPATSAAPALITAGRIGANTLSPDATSALDVNGTIVIRGGSPGTGKVLTSDINGKATWQTPTPIGYTAGTGININSGVISTNLVAGSGITITGNTISTNTSSGGGWTEASGNIYQNNPFANGTITVGTDVPATDARMKILGNTSLPIGLRLSSGLANPANGIALSAVGRLRVNANNAREDIETGGAIVVGGAAVSTTPAEGTIQYAGTDLQGYVGGQWKSLTATGSGGSSPWTVSGNDISNSNTGKVLMGSATGTTSAKVEVADNTSFAKVMSISNNGAAYMTVLDVKETSTSGGPIGCDVCSGTAAIKSIATKGDALYASSATRGMYVKGGDAFYPAIVVENNSSSNVSIDLAKQIQIRGGNPGAGKVLTSDANGLATWQTPSGGSGSGWNTTGNSGLNSTNFIGNTDAVDLNFKTNNANGLTLTSGGALLATGSTSTGTTPATGAGSRMMWIPAKGAFRAGTVTGTHWNDIQLASYSTAFGYNTIAGGNYSFAVGNTASATGFTSFAIGDNVSASGSRSIAIGSNVNAGFQGAFCFGDMDFSNTLLASTTNQMNMRFSGGYRLFSNSASTIGVQLTAGGNSWSTISDRRKKENLKSVDGESFLKRIANMPLSSWNYIGQDKSQHRHYGPMAQDFFAAFGHDGIGTIGNDTTIAAADMDGVSFIAIQALEKRTTSLQAENRDLKTQNEALQKELLALRNDLNIVMTKINESAPKKSTTEESTTANLSTK